MKFITNYKEFDTGNDKSLSNFLSDVPVVEKQKILIYLKNGEDDGVRCSGITDYITGKQIPDTVRLYTDGEFYWDDEEIYHFEKYNLELEKNFLKKVLG